jgi:aminodeoxyfutalosine deaminase
MIITSSKLITCMPGMSLMDNAAVVVMRGITLAIGQSNHIIQCFPNHRIIHLQNAVLMPGLVNTHTHLELPPLLDTIRAHTFPDWVLNLIRAKRKLSENDYKAAAEKNIETLVQTGATTIGEICTHSVSPVLLKQRGLRATVFREIISMSGRNANPPLPPFFKSRLCPLVSKGGTRRLVQSGLSPHAPYTVCEPSLRHIAAMSKKKDIHLAMHVAESKDEIRLLQRKTNGLEKLYKFVGWDLAWAPTGSSSFEYLNRTGLLSPALLAVHAVQVTYDDIKLIKKSKTTVAHCPRSNRVLGVGRMPLRKFLDAGITVGLGTDSLASAPSLNMWDEMRYAYRIHGRDGITPRDIFRLATLGGAKALGLDKEIGTIEKGKKADIIAVPLPNKNTGDLYSDLLRETKSCIMTMVNGKILFKEGQGTMA